MNRNPSPRETFMNDTKRVSGHNALLDQTEFHDAIQTCLLEYQRRLAAATISDLGGCASTHFRSVGAVEFVNLLLNLCESQVIPATTDRMNLPGNIRQMPQPPSKKN